MSFETESLSTEVKSTNVISTVSVANVDLTSNDNHTAAMLSSPDQTTITSEKSGTTDSKTTKVMIIETSSSTDISAKDAMTTETSRSTDSTTTDPMTTETTGSTNSTTDVFTIEISSPTDSTTTDVITTGMSSPTDSSAADVVTTGTSRATDSITTEVVTTKASSPSDSTTTDLMTTEISSLTHSSTTKVMITEKSSPRDSTITEVMSTVTSDSTATDTITAETLGPADSTATNALISVPIESTTSNALLTATTSILQTTAETPTAFDSTTTAVPSSAIVNISDTPTPDEQATTLPSNYFDSTSIMSTTGRLDETCIMTYEFSGGTHEVPCYNDTYSWIVIQRRFDGNVDFYRNWNEYKLGFGSINTEFWLGNDNIHDLTSVFGYTHLRIEIKDFDGQEGYAEYTFSIDDESSLYMIHILWISGNITDKLWLTDGASFCTYDQDNDGSKSKVCTTDFHGGWWYAWSAFCTEANPNGLYYYTYTPEKTGIFWFGFGTSSYHTLKEVRMMIRKP
ncbi:angiopoietin-2-like [Crassostrea angulata]|uniref:angiopoietin-2-like n=1 Tax=Magallana angulata TaxID=2784310 RepID=UPI0022B0D373|nr:angiopoietin-2-like [Crassostrea angulata]